MIAQILSFSGICIHLKSFSQIKIFFFFSNEELIPTKWSVLFHGKALNESPVICICCPLVEKETAADWPLKILLSPMLPLVAELWLFIGPCGWLAETSTCSSLHRGEITSFDTSLSSAADCHQSVSSDMLTSSLLVSYSLCTFITCKHISLILSF